MGMVGGLLGAVYNALNRHITIFRAKHIATPARRVMEAITIAAVVSLSAFVVPLFLQNDCPAIPAHGTDVTTLARFTCESGQYKYVLGMGMGMEMEMEMEACL